LVYERQPRPFQAGGTLGSDAVSYIERNADQELLDHLLHGELCYVLTSRQMGKSSLMARASSRLRQRSVAVVTLDLTAIGQNVTREQWYEGLAGITGRQLGMEDELESYWKQQQHISPMQRYFRVIDTMVLPRSRGSLVIFIDEIDAVRSLPFSSSEFFAALRESCNRRAIDGDWERVAFCLLGAALPQDLVSDPSVTPFNVGRRIVLRDFTLTEARHLALGLRRSTPVAETLIERVIYWTNGHPYLTQRLCRELAEDQSVQTASAVDEVCHRLFMSAQSQEEDMNLSLVRTSLLRHGSSYQLLQNYQAIRVGSQPDFDQTDQALSQLELIGVIRLTPRGAEVRNRIYAHLFDSAWIAKQLCLQPQPGHASNFAI
jgi:hypothetical protein